MKKLGMSVLLLALCTLLCSFTNSYKRGYIVFRDYICMDYYSWEKFEEDVYKIVGENSYPSYNDLVRVRNFCIDRRLPGERPTGIFTWASEFEDLLASKGWTSDLKKEMFEALENRGNALYYWMEKDFFGEDIIAWMYVENLDL